MQADAPVGPSRWELFDQSFFQKFENVYDSKALCKERTWGFKTLRYFELNFKFESRCLWVCDDFIYERSFQLSIESSVNVSTTEKVNKVQKK